MTDTSTFFKSLCRVYSREEAEALLKEILPMVIAKEGRSKIKLEEAIGFFVNLMEK